MRHVLRKRFGVLLYLQREGVLYHLLIGMCYIQFWLTNCKE